MGGVAIYVSFAIGWLLFARSIPASYPILIAGTILFITGVIDDLVQLKPYIKLVMQIVASSLIVYHGLYLEWTGFEPLDYLITVFWLVGLTNAVNLLDNMDGLAGGISLIACAFLAITFLLNGQTAEAVLPLVLAAAVFGFLCFNFNPASIFMGDCGSMLLGLSLGGIALLNDMGRTRNLAAVFLTPVLILMIPIFDTCVVTITRKMSGRPVSQGGRDHTSHRLVALGMSERRAVLALYLLAAVSGTMALLVREMRSEVTLLLIAGFALTILFIGLYLGKVRVYEEGTPASGTLIDVLANLSHRRRIFEILLDFCLIILAYYGAYLLRFESGLPSEQIRIFIRTLPLVIAIQILTFLAGGVYRGIWRYAGVDDLVVIAKSVFFGTLASATTVTLLYDFFGPSRAVFILDMLLLLFFVSASRLSFRLLGALLVGRRIPTPDARPVLIYGAGDGGEILIRELLNNPAHRYQPVGFIDDDARKTGLLIRGYRIFSRDDLPELINEHGVSEVLISSVKVPESKLHDLQGLGIGFKRLRIQLE
jgi:UDP-GlcNAc:undecaprenyl-phosphate GlcNAc-1-phosphate transferase